jgi:fatty-acyl-CoA synthase
MQGLMQHHQLLISSILDHAARHHGQGEIVSRRDDGTLSHTTYAALARRARSLAAVLRKLGVRPGDRVGTLAMNSDRHVELYYGIAGIGAVCNTINPRLAPDDVAYIVSHAEDGLIFIDPAFLPIVQAIGPNLAVRAVVVMTDAACMPQAASPPGIALLCYESLMAAAGPDNDWPLFDENTASNLCYTSGTTGRPKGVLYSHRSTLLCAMAMNSADALAARATDRILAAVPMFHVNAWGLPYVAPMAGAALLMPGRHLDPASLLSLMNAERATIGVGVPTIWLGLLNHLRDCGGRLETLKRIFVGGAAMPRALIAAYDELGVEVRNAWGMTESSPIVTINAPKPASAGFDRDQLLDQKTAQGRCVFGADVRAQGDDGRETSWDGTTQGQLFFRGHWVATGYYGMPDGVGEGWFPTGDVGVIDAEGFVTLTDRTKDLIKSGGEWISSIAIENIAVAHPEVAEAAAIAIPHEKWGERPLLVVVARPGCAPSPDSLREFCRGKMPDWSIPDRVVIAESIPHGATGKILKTELRRLYAVVTPRP